VCAFTLLLALMSERPACKRYTFLILTSHVTVHRKLDKATRSVLRGETVAAGEAITHRCPRCQALVHQMCIQEELASSEAAAQEQDGLHRFLHRFSWLRIEKEAEPSLFLKALDPSNPGMKGRMLLDEAMASKVDYMQCKATMCCIACALELRCCVVRRPFLVATSSCSNSSCHTLPGLYIRWPIMKRKQL
jgi:hypothetical protein